MDPKSHRRFLEYLEKYEYFGGPDVHRLTRERWLLYDAERQPLEERAARDALTANERARLRMLRKVLLVD